MAVEVAVGGVAVLAVVAAGGLAVLPVSGLPADGFVGGAPGPGLAPLTAVARSFCAFFTESVIRWRESWVLRSAAQTLRSESRAQSTLKRKREGEGFFSIVSQPALSNFAGNWRFKARLWAACLTVFLLISLSESMARPSWVMVRI